MKQEQVWQEFSDLPPTAQQLVMDFMNLLREKYMFVTRERMDSSPANLKDEPFVGMWQERSEMHDSNEFVRNLRASEWSTPHE